MNVFFFSRLKKLRSQYFSLFFKHLHFVSTRSADNGAKHFYSICAMFLFGNCLLDFFFPGFFVNNILYKLAQWTTTPANLLSSYNINKINTKVWLVAWNIFSGSRGSKSWLILLTPELNILRKQLTVLCLFQTLVKIILEGRLHISTFQVLFH